MLVHMTIQCTELPEEFPDLCRAFYIPIQIVEHGRFNVEVCAGFLLILRFWLPLTTTRLCILGYTLISTIIYIIVDIQRCTVGGGVNHYRTYLHFYSPTMNSRAQSWDCYPSMYRTRIVGQFTPTESVNWFRFPVTQNWVWNPFPQCSTHSNACRE